MGLVTVAWATRNPRMSLILVRLAGIEPTTLGFGEQKTNYVHLVILRIYVA
ncbi:hypothetical protein FQZ97_999160 [compost metagenome]